MELLNSAWEVLSDPERKEVYDNQLINSFAEDQVDSFAFDFMERWDSSQLNHNFSGDFIFICELFLNH
ncbi:hypothetical protein ACOSQ3_017610 [Xanthoceras sorbifolium]